MAIGLLPGFVSQRECLIKYTVIWGVRHWCMPDKQRNRNALHCSNTLKSRFLRRVLCHIFGRKRGLLYDSRQHRSGGALLFNGPCK